MANAIYPKCKETWLAKTGPDLDTDDIRVSLVDNVTYTYTGATDQTGADIDAVDWIQMSPTLTTKSVALGVFDADNVTFTVVPAGDPIDSIIIHTLEAADFTGTTTTDTGDVFGETGHGMTEAANSRVTLSNITSTTGISENIIYYVVNETANTFQLSLTSAGTPVTLTTDGSCDVHKMDSCKLIAYIDTATGLDVTPNGSDITITWDSGASKIFSL